MGERPTDDLALPRAMRNFRESSTGAMKLAQQVPQCKLVQDFLVAHNLPEQAFYVPFAIPRTERQELKNRLQALSDATETERVRLCALYGVANADELPHDRRVFFDTALRAFIAREDHYP